MDYFSDLHDRLPHEPIDLLHGSDWTVAEIDVTTFRLQVEHYRLS